MKNQVVWTVSTTSGIEYYSGSNATEAKETYRRVVSRVRTEVALMNQMIGVGIKIYKNGSEVKIHV